MADHDDRGLDQARNAQRGHAKRPPADYELQAMAIRAKTERLKALRLARDAAEGPAAPKRLRPARPRSGAKGKATSATLSDWLDAQEKAGRHT